MIQLPPWLTLTLVAAAALQRAGELALAYRHLGRTAEETGLRTGTEGVRDPAYPLMVVLHAAWLAGCAAEPLLVPRAVPALLWLVAAAGLLGALALRVWTLRTLGRFWHVRVVRRERQPVITGGPYHYIRHPNYLVVVLELATLPLLLGAYGTAILASLANVPALVLRIRREEAYLFTVPAYREAFARKARFVPGLF